MLFFVEGTGPDDSINWGDNFSGAGRFLSTVVTKPYVNNVVISPHVYPPCALPHTAWVTMRSPASSAAASSPSLIIDQGIECIHAVEPAYLGTPTSNANQSHVEPAGLQALSTKKCYTHLHAQPALCQSLMIRSCAEFHAAAHMFNCSTTRHLHIAACRL